MRLQTIGLLLILCLLMGPLRAQEEFVPKPSRFITSFHFKTLTGGVITLKAKFSDFKDSLNFILDTGSGGIAMRSADRANRAAFRSGRNSTMAFWSVRYAFMPSKISCA